MGNGRVMGHLDEKNGTLLKNKVKTHSPWRACSMSSVSGMREQGTGTPVDGSDIKITMKLMNKMNKLPTVMSVGTHLSLSNSTIKKEIETFDGLNQTDFPRYLEKVGD